MTLEPGQEDARSEGERFYEEEVAPVLKALSHKCLQRGMAFVAAVEYSPGERGTTRALTGSAGLPMVMLSHCARMGENIDGFVMGLARYAKEKGIDVDSSIVMNYINYGTITPPDAVQSPSSASGQPGKG